MFSDCVSKISTVIFRVKKDEARLELRKKYKFSSPEPFCDNFKVCEYFSAINSFLYFECTTIWIQVRSFIKTHFDPFISKTQMTLKMESLQFNEEIMLLFQNKVFF